MVEVIKIMLRLQLTSLARDAIRKAVNNYSYKDKKSYIPNPENLINEILLELGSLSESAFELIKEAFIKGQE